MTGDVFKRVHVSFLTSVFAVQACEDCANMNKRLREVPNSIEELSDKRDWMKQIPELIRNYRVRSRDLNRSPLLEKENWEKCSCQNFDNNPNHSLCLGPKTGGT